MGLIARVQIKGLGFQRFYRLGARIKVLGFCLRLLVRCNDGAGYTLTESKTPACTPRRMHYIQYVQTGLLKPLDYSTLIDVRSQC